MGEAIDTGGDTTNFCNSEIIYRDHWLHGIYSLIVAVWAS